MTYTERGEQPYRIYFTIRNDTSLPVEQDNTSLTVEQDNDNFYWERDGVV